MIDILDNFEKIVAKPGEMTKFNVYSAVSVDYILSLLYLLCNQAIKSPSNII